MKCPNKEAPALARASKRAIGKRLGLQHDALHSRLPLICELRDAVPRLPQIWITDHLALALSGPCGYATAEGQNQEHPFQLRR
jgi:hypothetical protein